MSYNQLLLEKEDRNILNSRKFEHIIDINNSDTNTYPIPKINNNHCLCLFIPILTCLSLLIPYIILKDL